MRVALGLRAAHGDGAVGRAEKLLDASVRAGSIGRADMLRAAVTVLRDEGGLFASSRASRAWLFAAPGDLRALCRGARGEELPGQLGPWQLVRAVDLAGLETDEAEASRQVALHGFCCFSAAGA